MTMDPKKREKVNALMRQYYEGNAKKNLGNNEETKALKALAVELKDETEPFVFAATNALDLQAGEVEVTDTTIDPKLVFKLYPELFWELVSIPKGRAAEVLGDKGATKCSVEITKRGFKIEKVKKV